MATDKQSLDPVFVSARREAIFILALFAICCVWAILVYLFDGYHPAGAPQGQLPIVLGMPRWVFWGIFVPWVFVDVVTVWFVFFFMRDEDLGESLDELEMTNDK